MALAMKHLQTVKQQEWRDLFPAISNVTDSLLFIKRLTNLALPTILFIRKILPESEFDCKIFEGMTLKVLKTQTRNANTERIQTWLAGAFDALEKKYLKSMSLEIKDSKSDLTLEIYTISIMDNMESASMSVSIPPGKQKNISFRDQLSTVQLQTVRLLQMCYSVAKSCLDLPPEVTIFMKLSYQENVPPDYHPFGYKAYIPAMPIFLKKTRTFEIGVVNTNHHIIEFMNKICLCDETILPKAGKERNNDDPNKGSESPCYFSKGKQKTQNPDPSQNTPLSTLTNKHGESNSEISSQCIDDRSQSDLVRCPCLSKIKTSVMFQCSGCRYWVHAECFGIRLKNVLNAIKIFYCQICDKLNNDCECPDELMIKLDRAADQQKLAVKRRLLSFCNRFEGEEVPFRKFEKVSGLSCHRNLLENIAKDLINMGVLNRQSGSIYRVNKNKVSEVVPHFFSTGYNSSHPIPVHAPAQMTPLLGKRKLQKTDESDGKVSGTRGSLSERLAKKNSAKKCLR